MRKMLVRMLAVSAVGALLFSATPAQAHHKNSVNALKARIAVLEAKVRALQTRTQFITPGGEAYGGSVYMSSIYTFEESDDCAVGDAAVWVADPEFAGDELLSCETSSAGPTSTEVSSSSSSTSFKDVVAQRL